MKSPLPRVLLLLAAAVLPLSCGGGGGSASVAPRGPGGTTANLLITDAEVDDLTAFGATVTAFELIREDGSRTGNLLAGPRAVEMLELQGQSELLQVAGISPGTYSGADVSFRDPFARDLMGSPVGVRIGAGSVRVSFLAPVIVNTDDSVNVRLHVDLESSLEDDPLGPGIVFEPEVELERRSGSSEPLDEVHGRLLDKDAASRRFTLRLVDRETGTALGTLPVQVGNGTAFFDDNGVPTTEAAFFATANAGDRVESDGALDGRGVFQATTVKLEDEDNGVARIEGMVADLDLQANRLGLRIREIERGRSVVTPVLAGLGNPGVIDVDFRNAVIVVEGPVPRRGMPADLAVGQEIKVKFSAFTSEPFPARRIEIEDERPELEGTITDVSGLPNGFVMRLEPHDPAVLSGRVQSSRTDVSVELDGSERIWLKVPHEPILNANQLLTGLRVRVRGILSGPASGPTVEAGDVRVRPGRLEGLVTGGNGMAGTFTVRIDEVDKPFGGSALPSQVMCTFAPGARVEREARSVEGFFGLLSMPGSQVEVRLFGISDGSGGVFAHEVEARRR